MHIEMEEKVTIVDVARLAEVSPGTVSRVLNNDGTTPRTRDKVLQAVKELGYRPNPFARGMRSMRKNCIGVLMESGMGEDDPWLEKIVLAITSALSEMRLGCMTEFWSNDSERMPALLDSVDGCILLGNYPDSFFRRIERQWALPLVTYNEKMPYERGISLQVDWDTGMRRAVQYLLAHRHENIGLVIAGTKYPSLRARYDAFKSALSDFGREPDPSQTASCEGSPGGTFFSAGGALTSQLLDSARPVSAIIYGTDFMAFGGMEVLREREISVPQDLSVVGFDNTDWGRMMNPPLTTVGVDYHQLSLRLLEALEVLQGRSRRMPELTLEPTFVERKSAGNGAH